MARFNPATVTATAPAPDTIQVAVNGTGSAYQYPLSVVKDILSGRDADPRYLLFLIAVGLDAQGFTFAGKTPLQIKTAVEALTNLVWAP